MGKFLRFVAIVFMGLTAVFTLLGGAGTTCVALAAERWDSMAALAPYKGIYLGFVLATLAVGVMLTRAFWMLARGRQNAYRASLVALILAVGIGVIHIAVSRALRGASMPVDAVTYTAVLTLILFLLLRLPGVWEKVNFERAARPDDSTGPMAAAITLLLSGLVVLTVQHWAGTAHTFDGANWADAWHGSLQWLGFGLMGSGLFLAGGRWIWNRGVVPALRRGQAERPYRLRRA